MQNHVLFPFIILQQGAQHLFSMLKHHHMRPFAEHSPFAPSAIPKQLPDFSQNKVFFLILYHLNLGGQHALKAGPEHPSRLFLQAKTELFWGNGINDSLHLLPFTYGAQSHIDSFNGYLCSLCNCLYLVWKFPNPLNVIPSEQVNVFSLFNLFKGKYMNICLYIIIKIIC